MLWGVLDAPEQAIPGEEEGRAAVLAAVKQNARAWPRKMTGTTAAARRTHDALLQAWGRGRGVNPPQEIDAALARLFTLWPNPALEGLVGSRGAGSIMRSASSRR
jgi:hypothetical protein